MDRKPRIEWTEKLTEKLFRSIDKYRTNGIIAWNAVSAEMKIRRDSCAGRYHTSLKYGHAPEWFFVIQPRKYESLDDSPWQKQAAASSQKLLTRLIEVHGPNCCA